MSTRNQNRTSPRVAQPRRQGRVTTVATSLTSDRVRPRVPQASGTAVPVERERSVAVREVITRPAATGPGRASMAARTSVVARNSVAARTSVVARNSVAARTSVVARNSLATRTSVASRTPISRPPNLAASRVSTRRTTRVEEKPLNPIVEVAEVDPLNNSINLNDSSISIGYQFICPICMIYPNLEGRRIFATSCGHVFCEECLLEAYNIKKVCPMCQQATSAYDFRELYL